MLDAGEKQKTAAEWLGEAEVQLPAAERLVDGVVEAIIDVIQEQIDPDWAPVELDMDAVKITQRKVNRIDAVKTRDLIERVVVARVSRPDGLTIVVDPVVRCQVQHYDDLGFHVRQENFAALVIRIRTALFPEVVLIYDIELEKPAKVMKVGK